MTRGYTGPFATVRVTRGPRQHFFGYYDKCPWNASEKLLLAHEAPFDARSPGPSDQAVLGVIDLENQLAFEPVTQTRAWCWQQGAMLQWWPGEPESAILYNDCREGQFVSVLRQIHSGHERVLPRPVSAVRFDGKIALSVNYARLANERPGYGYVGLPDPYAREDAPEADGIFTVDLTTGDCRLILSLRQIAGVNPRADMDGVHHWVDHVLFSPDGRRFIFLHRWRRSDGGWYTRLFTANADGSGLFCANDHDFNSHFDWYGSDRVLVWGRRFGVGDRYFLFTDQSDAVEILGDGSLTPFGDGHCNWSPDRRWLLTDTYPDERQERCLLLYQPETDLVVELGRYYSVPWVWEARCDLHPRWGRDGRKVCFDSSHEGSRQLYVIQVSEAVIGRRGNAAGREG